MTPEEQQLLRMIVREETGAAIDRKMESYGIKAEHFIFLREIYDKVQANKMETSKIVRKIAIPLAISALIAALNIDAFREFLTKHLG